MKKAPKTLATAIMALIPPKKSLTEELSEYGEGYIQGLLDVLALKHFYPDDFKPPKKAEGSIKSR